MGNVVQQWGGLGAGYVTHLIIVGIVTTVCLVLLTILTLQHAPIPDPISLGGVGGIFYLLGNGTGATWGTKKAVEQTQQQLADEITKISGGTNE